MNFKPSLAAEEFIENIHGRVGARNKAVLGRSALMLALGEGVPPNFKVADAGGKDLNDETVIGDELRDVVRSALNYRAGNALDETAYRQQFRLHFEYGCVRLKQIWEDSGNDQVRFVSELLKIAGNNPISSTRNGANGTSFGTTRALPIVESEVRLKLLNDAPTWFMNEPGSNSLLLVSGQPGSGKSQLALDLLVQLANHGVRFVFFDLKGELEDDPTSVQQRENRRKFLEATQARHVRLPREGLPINPLYRDANAAVNAQIANEIASLVRAFAPQLGANQQQALTDAYQKLQAPDFPSLLDQLEADGVSGVPHSIIKRIVDSNLFAPARNAITPEEWLSQSLVFDFKEFGNDSDTKALTTALVLNFLMKRLNQNLGVVNGVQPLKMVLFVDEAHLLLPKEGRAGLLGSLARQGRSWGFPVWLASQDADAFVTTGANATDFAELAECGLHFSPQTLNKSQQRQILGGELSRSLQKGEAALRLGGKLQTGATRQFWRDGGK